MKAAEIKLRIQVLTTLVVVSQVMLWGYALGFLLMQVMK